MDFGKGALVFTTFSIHIHSVTIAIFHFGLSYGIPGKHDGMERDDAVKAFLIISYLLYLFSFLVQVINHSTCSHFSSR